MPRPGSDGAHPPLVFSHALGLDRTMWEPLVGEFSTTHRVLSYDHRGHGSAQSPGTQWSLDDLVEDAARLIVERADGPVIFIGLSMGGMVAQGLAIRYPELIRAAVLAHTVASYGEAARQAWAQRAQAVRTGGMASVADAVVARYLGEAFRSAHPQAVARLRTQLLANDPQAYATHCEALAALDWLPLLHHVRCPVLVIAGRHDMGAPVAEGQRIADAVPGARLAVLEHSAHLSPVEEPLALTALLRQFLDTLE
jgi:3-oxoadipate enol-lactonase